MGLRNDLAKYVNYVFDTKSFSPDLALGGISDQALESAQGGRGAERAPALIIHGVMPRSGTVYVGELLRLHPDLYAYPNEIWEIPFLQQTGEILKLQEKFFLAYEQNIGKIGEHDFLPLFGSAFIGYLYSAVPVERRMLLKIPSVQYLNSFYSVFPHENLLVLVRDGRDLVHSTLKTWPQLRFSLVCRRWKRAAQMVLRFDSRYARNRDGYWLAKFEDAVRDPATFVAEICGRFDLDVQKYPFERIQALPVHGSSSLRTQGTVNWNATEKPQDFRPVGHWKKWSPGKKRTFKRIAGQTLMELGYCEDLGW